MRCLYTVGILARSCSRSGGRSEGLAELALAPIESTRPPKRSAIALAIWSWRPTAANRCTTSSDTSLAIWSHWPARVMALSLRPRSPSPCTSNTGQ